MRRTRRSIALAGQALEVVPRANGYVVIDDAGELVFPGSHRTADAAIRAAEKYLAGEAERLNCSPNAAVKALMGREKPRRCGVCGYAGPDVTRYNFALLTCPPCRAKEDLEIEHAEPVGTKCPHCGGYKPAQWSTCRGDECDRIEFRRSLDRFPSLDLIQGR